MSPWKPLLLIAPAGIVLGMIGGHLAQPVLTQRESDATLQAMFQTRADRYGRDASDTAQPQSVSYYNGGYSYAPDWAGNVNSGWSPPREDAWSYSYAVAPLPTIAQLDARQAALLADPDKQYAVHPPVEPTEPAAAPQAASAEPATAQGQDDTVALAGPVAESGPEPHAADGQPAIW